MGAAVVSWLHVIIGSMVVISVVAENELARGWGDSIDWKDFETGLKLAQSENKQLMLVIHKTWCGACKVLKPLFAESKEIGDLSSNFIMVNTQDDEEPMDEKFAHDKHRYIPRIFFLTPEGEVRKNLYNEKESPAVKYAYNNAEEVLTVMKRAMSPPESESVSDPVSVVGENELARGWGDSIDWKDFETGLKLAQSENKQLMLIIHKTWCGACKELKPKFAESKEIADLSSNFIMVHTQDDEEPMDEKFAHDGYRYIPRIFFLTPEGDVRENLYNEKMRPEVKYGYTNADDVVTVMKRAMSDPASVVVENELARGWGDSIDWKDLETGLKLAQSENKQLMLIIHKTWCGACKELKPKFAESKEIADLSSNFIMVNTQDDEEPMDEKFVHDGYRYIPRIFFLTPEGEVRKNLYNEKKRAAVKYAYSTAEDVITVMKRAMSPPESDSVSDPVSVVGENELARGWGDSIDWKDFETGLKLAQSENKQLMLIIHKTWCGACKVLKPKFAESKEIADLSSNFIMVNTQDDEQPMDEKFAHDGYRYIPRIFFLTPEGEVRKNLYNEKERPAIKYSYNNAEEVLTVMKRAMSPPESESVSAPVSEPVKEEL